MRGYRGINIGVLRALIADAFGERLGGKCEVTVDGWIDRLGTGLWHDNYRFSIRGKKLTAEWTGRDYVLRLLLPQDERYEEQTSKERLLLESKTLATLAESDFPYPTPEFICLVRDEAETIGMIETALPGGSMENLKGDASKPRFALLLSFTVVQVRQQVRVSVWTRYVWGQPGELASSFAVRTGEASGTLAASGS
jgi:hypothetical protein